MRSRCSRHEFCEIPLSAQYVFRNRRPPTINVNPRNRSETFAAEFLICSRLESRDAPKLQKLNNNRDQQRNGPSFPTKMQQVIDKRFWRGEQVGPTADSIRNTGSKMLNSVIPKRAVRAFRLPCVNRRTATPADCSPANFDVLVNQQREKRTGGQWRSEYR